MLFRGNADSWMKSFADFHRQQHHDQLEHTHETNPPPRHTFGVTLETLASVVWTWFVEIDVLVYVVKNQLEADSVPRPAAMRTIDDESNFD